MEQTQDYDDNLVMLLEVLWGDGYLSPGGDHETALVLDGLDLRDMRVLDLGCCTGGCAQFIAGAFGPAEVIGVVDGRLRFEIESRVGRAFLDHEVEVWTALCGVFDTRELGAGHWRAIKP